MDTEPSDWYERLSPKEREVLETYSEKHSYEAVARALHKSESVVDQQLLSARRKMGVASTAEAMYLLAQRKALLTGKAHPQRQVADGSDLVAEEPRRQIAIRRAPWISLALLLAACLGAALAISTVYPKQSPIPAYRDFAELNFAAKSLDGGAESVELQTRLMERFAELAWNASYGPEEEEWVRHAQEWKARIESTLSTLSTKEPDAVSSICGKLYRIAYLAKLDIEPYLTESLSRSANANTEDYVRALNAASYIHAGPEGVRLANRAAQIAYSLKDWEGYYNAIRLRGFSRAVEDENSHFRDDYLRALRGFEALEKPRMVALTYLCLGITLGGQTNKNVEWAGTALRSFRKIGNRWGIESCQDIVEGAFANRPFDPEWALWRDEWVECMSADATQLLARGDHKRAWAYLRRIVILAEAKQWNTVLSAAANQVFVHVRDHGGPKGGGNLRRLAGALASPGKAYAYILARSGYKPWEKGLKESTDPEVLAGRKLGLRAVLHQMLSEY